MPRKRKYTKRKKNYWQKRKKSKYYRASWEPDFTLNPEVARSITGIALVVLAIFSLLSILGMAGPLGQLWYGILKLSSGWSAIFITLLFGFLGYALLKSDQYEIKATNILGVLLFISSLTGFFHLIYSKEVALEAAKAGSGGGFLGYYISQAFKPLIGGVASSILLASTFVISNLLIFNTSIKEIKEKFFSKPEEEKTQRLLIKKPLKIQQKEGTSKSLLSKLTKREEKQEEKEIKGPLKEGAINLPPIELLEEAPSLPHAGNVKKNAEIIRQTLANFGIPVEMVDVNIGPTVTQYTLRPTEGIKLNKITALHNDLALALAAHPIRIEAPIPGKSLVGIEVPNKVKAIVRLREVLTSPNFKNTPSPLTVALGKDVSGQCIVDDLDQMPHLLIAGATGTGKSICINSIILSLLYRNSPQNLKTILIDPKRVELPVYNGIPHLLAPVVTDYEKAISALKWSVAEMDRRYKIFEKNLKRDIVSYNKSVSKKLPYIVIAIDELADLMMLAPQEVEGAIVRLSQLARATGIHLVIATQRPSVDVITGLIKANITNRIAFATASQVDSRTILDTAGAEKLLGAGDMLYLSGDISKPKRIQGTYVSEKEIKSVVDFLKKQGQPEYQESVFEMPIKSKKIAGELAEDELYKEAARLVIESGKASASFIQRRLRVGYARAARLLDILEERGVVSPANGAKPRQVLIDSWEELDNLENQNEELENNI